MRRAFFSWLLGIVVAMVFVGEGMNVEAAGPGIITTFAGNGAAGYTGDGGVATSASINTPYGVAANGVGNVYIADFVNCVVRRVTGGTISTFAGNGSCGDSGDGGLATSAQLKQVSGLAVDRSGDLYIPDYQNCRIRKVSGGVITTFAGSSCGYDGDSGPATSAKLSGPQGVAVDNAGNVFVADTGNCVVRAVVGGIITTVAGDGTCGYGGDGGAATSAKLNWPEDVAADGAGNVYVVDYGNCRIRRVAGGDITTFAGNGTCAHSGDGGLATSASLFNPYGIVVAGADVYIADSHTSSSRVRKVSGGIITTFAGTGSSGFSGDGGPATSAQLNNPVKLAMDGAGNLYIADAINNRVRRVAAPISVGGTAEQPDVEALPLESHSATGGRRMYALIGTTLIALAGTGGWYVRRRRAV